jgi:hypothetical protein
MWSLWHSNECDAICNTIHSIFLLKPPPGSRVYWCIHCSQFSCLGLISSVKDLHQTTFSRKQYRCQQNQQISPCTDQISTLHYHVSCYGWYGVWIGGYGIGNGCHHNLTLLSQLKVASNCIEDFAVRFGQAGIHGQRCYSHPPLEWWVVF